MGKYRRFASRADAMAYANRFNEDAGLPIVGKVNGVPAPQNQQTIRWCESPIDCADDKSAVPEVPDGFYTSLGIGATGKADIISTYVTTPGATLEDYSDTWDPTDETTGDPLNLTNVIGDATVTAKSEQGENTAAMAADNTPTTFWRGNADPQWIMAQYGTPQTVKVFVVKARLGETNAPWAIGFPIDFVLEGSNNGTNFTVLRTLEAERFIPGEKVRYRVPVANQAGYKYYRLRVTKSSSDANISIAEWRLFV